MGVIQKIGGRIGSGIQSVRESLGKKISQPVQQNNYGTGFSTGGTTYVPTGTTTTSTGVSTPTSTPSTPTVVSQPSPSVSVVASQNPMNIVQKGNVQDYVKKSGGGSGSSGITPATPTQPKPQAQVSQNRNQAAEAARINAQARRAGISPAQMLIKRNAAAARNARFESRGSKASPGVSSSRSSSEQYVQERQVRTFKAGGRNIPIVESVVTDSSGKVIRKATKEETASLKQQKNAVRVPEETPTGLEGSQYKLQRKREVTYQRGGNTLKSEGVGAVLGLGSSVLGTLQFGKNVITKPVQTIKSIPAGVKQTAYFVKSGELAKTLYQQPGYSLGYAGGEAGTLKAISSAPKGALKITDAIRTRKLIELPKESIIAPEYFRGQNYPAIKKGQTAGQLKQEFQPAPQYGVTRLTGFTASPKPFSSVTEAAKGSSELPGVYQAPKVSPNFLRISADADKKLFSLNVIDTFRPSVIKITPKSTELIPGVSQSQKSLTPLTKAKQFYEYKAQPGKSYVPFVKTEKEAIIPAGTKFEQTGKRFYFEFEKRKVPIQEFEVADLKATNLKAINKAPLKEKVYTTKDISSISSRGTRKSVGVINPYSILTSSRVAKYSSSVPITPSSSRLISSSRAKPKIYSSYVRKIASSRRSGGSSRKLFTPSSYYSSGSSSYSAITPGGGSSTGGGKVSKKTFFGGRDSNKDFKATQSTGFGKYTVSLRRFGIFKPIGFAKSQRQAFDLGTKAAASSLGATFKVEGKGIKYPKKIKGFKTKLTKEGTLYIEQPKYRLSKSTEVKEIQLFKKQKGGKKK